MNEMMTFRNVEFGAIRTMSNEQGEPMFCARDVAEALGYKKPENAVAMHGDNEDKTTTLIQGSGSNYKTTAVFVNESGLYALILSSKLDSAKRFKRWVTNEVLPAIRKQGGYMMAKELDMTAQQLNRLLCQMRIQYWQSGQYMLYADYARQGFAKNRTRKHVCKHGIVMTETYLVWTERGRDFIHRLLDRKLGN